LQIVLQHLNASTNPADLDALVLQLRTPPVERDADVIGARTYELSLDGADYAVAHAQALADFKAGKLKRPEPVVEPFCPADEGCPSPTQEILPAPSSASSTCTPISNSPPAQPMPTNVVPFYCGQFFRRDPRDSDVW
jgi:hypothetical protein